MPIDDSFARNNLLQLPPLIKDLSLSYRLKSPAGAKSGLVLLLHGMGHSETSLHGFLDLLPEDLAVALVRLPLETGPGAYRAFSARFTPDGPVIDAVEAESSLCKLVDFVGEIQGRTRVAPSRTLIAGFSQGGIMANALALTNPQAVVGFCILSGRILPEIEHLIAPPAALSHLRALVLHGDNDEVLPEAWADRSAALLQRLGVSFKKKRHAAGHEITPAMANDMASWVHAVLGG